jgi:hypothetical protein
VRSNLNIKTSQLQNGLCQPENVVPAQLDLRSFMICPGIEVKGI